MIYTITLNPAIDYIVKLDKLNLGGVNRSKEEHIFYGGKGINVSYILNQLGLDSCALGFTAGFTGREFQRAVKKMGIKTDFIHVEEGMTRINVKIKAGQESEINGLGPKVKEEDLIKFNEKIKNLREGDILVISGSIPQSMSDETYENILEALEDKGIKVIVDARRDLLMKVLKYKPFLIKPNNIELEEIFGVKLKNDEEIIHYARKLKELGAKNVLVSMAGDGSILVDENDQVHKLGVAQGKLKNSVGAGDSMVAGFLAGYLKTYDYSKAHILGTACGGATAFHDGLATKEQIDYEYKKLIDNIKNLK